MENLWFQPSINQALLLLLSGAVLAVSCYRNAVQAPVHYQLPGDRQRSAALMAGVALGVMLVAGGLWMGYHVASNPPAQTCTTG